MGLIAPISAINSWEGYKYQGNVNELKSIILDHQDKNIVDVLSEIANQEDAYYDLAGHRNLDNAYELVIRLFSKIPFLQYNFVAEQKPMAVEKRIESEMEQKLLSYHRQIILSTHETDKENYILYKFFKYNKIGQCDWLKED